jgi:oligopeptide/dipeptide ABC transporter ATP-binding protein
MAHKRLAILYGISIMHRTKIIKKIFMNSILLSVEALTTRIIDRAYGITPVDRVNLAIKRSEIFCLVGESGCGKTMTVLSIIRLLPVGAEVVSGEVIFEGRDLLTLSEREMVGVRGNRIGMVFQEPMLSLNPVMRIGEQIGETMVVHKQCTKRDVKQRTIELLRLVGLNEPEKRYIQYPHQLSGGQRQRVLIAIAISCNPSLIIADEPTTALDVATESHILYLLKGLVDDHGSSMLFITHNLHIVKRLGHQVAIMYAGRIVEQGDVGGLFERPLHPYSRGLIDSVYGFDEERRRLKAIPGSVPGFRDLPSGCKFHPRCVSVMDLCRREEPALFEVGDNRWVRCFLYQG